MFIVYISSGSCSDYSVNQTLIGDKDPNLILNEYVFRVTEGKCTDWNNIGKMRELRKNFYDELLRNGFKEVEATEVWVGY